MAKVLFFEIQVTGHHSEYVGHLIDYLSGIKTDDRYFFVLHPEFSSRFREIADKAKKISCITWIEITENELAESSRGNLIRQSFLWYRLADNYAQKFDIDHMCLLYFNVFQLAMIFKRPSYTVSGILFLQFSRMSISSWSERLKYFRKYMITRGYALNRSINHVFILNDQRTVNTLNKQFGTTIFHMLPDPIPQLRALKGFDIYGHYQIPTSRFVFLHNGVLGDRKGTFEFLNAAKFIPKELHERITFLLVGKGNPERLTSEIESLRHDTDIQIIWDNQFVSNEFMKALFDQCYAVVIPYKNAEASSGILGHAAAARKIVITTGKGLLKEIVNEYGLGLLVEDVHPNLIADRIVDSIKEKVYVKKAEEFVLSHTPQFFAATLLER